MRRQLWLSFDLGCVEYSLVPGGNGGLGCMCVDDFAVLAPIRSSVGKGVGLGGGGSHGTRPAVINRQYIFAMMAVVYINGCKKDGCLRCCTL